MDGSATLRKRGRVGTVAAASGQADATLSFCPYVARDIIPGGLRGGPGSSSALHPIPQTDIGGSRLMVLVLVVGVVLKPSRYSLQLTLHLPSR